MTARLPLLALIPMLAIAACTPGSQSAPPASGSPASSPSMEAARTPVAAATLLTSAGAPAGSASLVSDAGGYTLIVRAENLPAGAHGLHFHTIGKCDAPGFTTAGAHLNPGAKMHGRDNPMGSHLGDLPNLTIGADGTGTLSARLPGTGAELIPALFDADGTAVLVHATADDYKTDPSGNSGSRIACGVLSQVMEGTAAGA